MQYETLGYTKNHIKVVFDPEHSHAATHFDDTPQLREAVNQVIANTVTTGEDMWFEMDMGRVAGVSDLVDTDETDEIVYAKRLSRDTYTRFTKSRRAQPSSLVTVAMNPLNDDTYELKSAWIGPVGYSFPDAPGALPQSREYWDKHAIVWGTQAIQPGTETRECPW
jgi:hypothetical protein